MVCGVDVRRAGERAGGDGFGAGRGRAARRRWRFSAGSPTPAATRARSTASPGPTWTRRSRRVRTSGRSCASRPACTSPRSSESASMPHAGCWRRLPTTSLCGCGLSPMGVSCGPSACRSATATKARCTRRRFPRTAARSPREVGTRSYAKSGDDGVYLIDLATGAVRRIRRSAQCDQFDRVFAGRGARRCRALESTGGFRVFDVASGKTLLSDTNYRDTIYGLAFAPDGSLVASSLDGEVRRYGADLRLAARAGRFGGHSTVRGRDQSRWQTTGGGIREPDESLDPRRADPGPDRASRNGRPEQRRPLLRRLVRRRRASARGGTSAASI